MLKRERRQEIIYFPSSVDHEQDWQPYLVDSFADMRDDHAYIHVYCIRCTTVFGNFITVEGNVQEKSGGTSYRVRRKGTKEYTSFSHNSRGI